jgi:hypothetical protein
VRVLARLGVRGLHRVLGESSKLALTLQILHAEQKSEGAVDTLFQHQRYVVVTGVTGNIGD